MQGGIKGESSGSAGGSSSISTGMGAGGNALFVLIEGELRSGRGLSRRSRRAEGEIGSGLDRCSGEN